MNGDESDDAVMSPIDDKRTISGLEDTLLKLKTENSLLTKENQGLKKQVNEFGRKKDEEVRKVEDSKSKEKLRYEQHIAKLEAYVEELKRDIKKHQDEVEKAIKIHRANE